MRKTILSIILALAVAGSAQGAGPVPTPEASTIVKLDIPGTLAWTMKAPLADTGHYVGFSLICSMTVPGELKATAFFGPFPHDRRPLEVAIRTPAGTIERFGPVVTAGPESGFHSLQITNWVSILRFANASLVPSSLISNGYNSFWNRASTSDNLETWKAFRACHLKHLSRSR